MWNQKQGPFWECESTTVHTQATSVPPFHKNYPSNTLLYPFSSNMKYLNLLLLFREFKLLLRSAFKPLRCKKAKGCCQLYQLDRLIWVIGLFSTVPEPIQHLITAKAKAKSECSQGPR